MWSVSKKSLGLTDFALHDGEVDLALVQPGGVDGQMDEPQSRPRSFQAVDRCLAPVRPAVVDDPEHPLGAGVRLAGHDLVDQPPERHDAGGVLAPAEHPGPVHVIGGQVGHRARARTRARRASDGTVPAAGSDGTGSGPGWRSSHPRRSRTPFRQGLPSNTRAYRSSTTAALAAKSGSRGKIHERWSHGRMASW